MYKRQGAANGIGKATVHAYAKSGAKIVLIDMNPDVAEFADEIARQYGIETLPVDVYKRQP